MKVRRLILCCLLSVAALFAGQSALADSGKFYIVGMGTIPDLLTLRGAKVIQDSQIVILEEEEDREAWKEYIGQKEVWIVPNSARLYFGLDPKEVSDPALKKSVLKSMTTRHNIIERITQAVRKGKTVSALQWGDPMMFGMTYYLELLPENIPSEIIPGVGAFQAAAAAKKMSPPYGWDTNSVILTAADWPGRRDTNEKLMVHQTSMVFYTMFLDYPALFQDLNRHYPPNTPVSVVCHAGDRDKQKIMDSTVGNFLQEVKYDQLPVHMLLVGPFLTAGQARKDALVQSRHLLQ